MEFCLKIGGSSSKAKYSWLTDSEQVLWRKGEKNPGDGSETETETLYAQAVGAGIILWLRTFCIMGQRVIFCSEINRIGES